MWLSRQKFIKLEEKVNRLDPENVSKGLKETLEELEGLKMTLLDRTTKEISKVLEDFQQAKKTAQVELEKIIAKAVGDQTRKLVDDLGKVQKDLKITDGQLAALTAETKKHVSITQEVIGKVTNSIRAMLDMLET